MKFTAILSALSLSQLISARKLDVEDPASFNHSSIEVNGHNYRNPSQLNILAIY
ncbi:hypothetical protein DSO57_1009348 [Entomophthora muscae]|uniref:Uncharacterized protein n=1 Tax=Entomophthora muscae TaxID=34485 RepID=A0ACC2RXY2_9FUNG|nr:hypothetical protein DSO57_1009348 [Entomophthora muscae]